MIFLLTTILLWTQNIPSSFKNYKKFTLKNDMDMELYISPILARNSSIVRTKGNDYTLPRRSLRFMLQSREVEVSFSRGASDDFNFQFRFEGENEPLRVYGDRLFLSQNGFLYVENSENVYYKTYKKFKLIGSKLKEIRQAYYKVNMKCKTSALTKLYSNKCQKGEIVATIPKNRTVRIILSDNKNSCPNEKNIKEYLVETSFGLVGWVSSNGGYGQRLGNPLGCLMFNGD